MRAVNVSTAQLNRYTTAQIVPNGGATFSVQRGLVPQGKLISQVYLRVRSDLIVAATAVQMNSAATLKAFFDALVSSVSISVPKHRLSNNIVQTMTLGSLQDMYARLGVYPICPQLWGEGQYFGTITSKPRAVIVPGPGDTSHFVTMKIPLVSQRLQKFGQSLYLWSGGSDGRGGPSLDGALDNMSIQLQFGTFTFTDANGATIDIPTGAGGATGVTSIDVCCDYEDAPGGPQIAEPLFMSRLFNGTTNQICLNPEGGAIASAVIRVPTIAGGNDSLDGIIRNSVFSSATNLDEQAEAPFNIQLSVNGAQPRDLSQRGLEFYAGIDMIEAQIDAVATAHGLRATNLAATGDAASAPSWYRDGGVPIVWGAPDGNPLSSLSIGEHQVTIPNAWNALGNREIFVAQLSPIDGNPMAKVVSPSVMTTKSTAKPSIFEACLRFLGLRT